jgi:hypothetical protein
LIYSRVKICVTMLHEVVLLAIFFIILCASTGQISYAAANADTPTYYPDEPACQVRSIRKEPTTFENAVISPVSDLMAVTQPDSKGVYQVYAGNRAANNLKCITCAPSSRGPRIDRNKPMIAWYPSGEWLAVGVEETTHANIMPKSWQRGLLQSGIWLNMWITTPTGDRWYQITDFKKPAKGPSDGYVGPVFTPDGKRAVWSEIIDGNIFANHFGVWRLFIADFSVSPDGVPSLVNKRDISPPGARWVEPGNFAPDGRHMLISSDIGMKDAQGQDQFVLDTATNQVRNLTNSPTIWDEHGLYSSDGTKISFMSSQPYRDEPNSNKATSLKTEFMLMDSDGSHLQQITHFNVPGYPESQPKNTVAAVAGFTAGGSQLFATVMSTDNAFTKTNWTITFEGQCGIARGTARPSRR